MTNEFFGPGLVREIVDDQEVVVNAVRYKGRRITADVEVRITLVNGLQYTATTTLHNMPCDDKGKSLPPEPVGRIITEGKDKEARRHRVPR